MNLKPEERKENDFQDLINDINLEFLERAYKSINECIQRAENYIQGW